MRYIFLLLILLLAACTVQFDGRIELNRIEGVYQFATFTSEATEPRALVPTRTLEPPSVPITPTVTLPTVTPDLR